MKMLLPAGDAPMRQSALLLHAMQPQDCRWILAQLPEPQRASVQVLLDELRDLGMAADDGLLRRMLADPGQALPEALSPMPTAAEAPVPAAPAPGDSEFFVDLDQSQVAALAQLLRAEPSALATRLLALREWPWREAVLAGVGPAQLRQIHAGLADAPALSAPLFEQTLLRKLRAKLEAVPLAAAVQADAGFSPAGASLGRWRHLPRRLFQEARRRLGGGR